MNNERGSAMLSTLVCLPLLGLLIGGTLQMGLLYKQKLVLEYAVGMGARSGAISNASRPSILAGLRSGLRPLYVGNRHEITSATLDREVQEDLEHHSCISIKMPSAAAIKDHDVTLADPIADNQIYPFELTTLPRTPGPSSGVSIQQAMMLHIEVTYGARPQVPVVGSMLVRLLRNKPGLSNAQRQLLSKGRIPLTDDAREAMQSAARMNALMQTRC